MPLFLKNKQSNFIVFGLILFILSACSLSKNTWSTRTYQSVNTKFNVFFNGMTSYEEGIRNITNANTEDYSSIIPMYAISKHENANSAKSNMDRTIEKCRKAIKLHSIKQKPVRNVKKWSDPEYQLWYKQEEFNPALKDAWMLLAKAEFHKADFLGSVGTFTYITRHYSSEKDLVAQCQLWMVRAYAEMGWIYEAEQVLTKIKQDDLKIKNYGLFAAVNADLLLKKKQYKEAIPFLEITLKNESSKVQMQRFNFLLAQLYSQVGNTRQAYEAYNKVIKLNPPYEMEFNARIYRAELDNRNPVAVRKELSKMLKNSNNKDYLDQIFYVIGKTYLHNSDTVKAIENFKLSAEKSTRNGLNKAQTLITLGDLYYEKQNYISAQPCYDEASKIITPTQDDFARVSKRAETLGELVVQNEIVTLQDSLQYLSTLSEAKRLAIVEKIISKLIEDEKKAEEAAKEKENNYGNPEDDFNPMPPLIGQNSGKVGDWYFFNPNLVKSGKSDFAKKWGKRKLEDNWRRTSKTASLFADDSQGGNNNAEQNLSDNDTTKKESTITDNKSPEFYLQQIPVTPAQIQKSNEEIATALFNMGMIYKDKVEDLPLAIKTFDLFAQRFPTDERRLESYFQSYMISLKLGKAQEVENYKQKLLYDFPKSKYAEVISQPDYFNRMMRMYSEQDSIYSKTYAAYNSNDFATVKKNLAFVQENYPLSTLMPKFMFLGALSIGKTDKPEAFEKKLTELVEKHPESDVSAMSKDILALMMQGRESKKGSTHGTLLTRRDNAVESDQITDVKKDFSTDKTIKHRLLLLVDTSTVNMNKLLFNVAAYNFSRFMVKDFDLVSAKFDSLRNSLSITNFESFEETEWYLNSIEKDQEIASLFRNMNATKIIISEENYGIIRSISNLDAYLAFKDKNLSTKTAQTTKLATNNNKAEPIAIEKDFVKKETKTPVSDKVVETKVENEQPKNVVKETPKPATELKTTAQTQQPKIVEPVEEAVPLFKNLFGYRANEQHFVAIAVLSGPFDFDKLKTVFNSYNSQNYSMLNLKLNTEKVNKMEIVIIGPFADANLAKSYLLRMVKERSLFEPLKAADYRNLLGSQKNLNIMMQKDAMTTYFEFMQQYYLN